MKEEQKKNRAKLVAALRSGEYKQGKGRLYDGQRYCPLGIACDLFSKEVGGRFFVDGNDYFFRYGSLYERNYLLDAVACYFGFASHTGRFISVNHGITSLALLNDDYDKSFLEIADIIESEPEGLFT